MTTVFDPAPDPLPNVPLLRKVREHIGAHPEEWDQTDWRTTPESRAARNFAHCDCRGCLIERQRQSERPLCSTAYCFAGWAVTIAGAEWVGPGSKVMLDGEHLTVSAAAESVLGLTDFESGELFYAGNNLPDIDRLLAAVYTRAGERP